MYYALSVAVGVLIALMIVVNGELYVSTALYASCVVIHVVGLLTVLCIMLIKKERLPKMKKLPLIMYSGGALGFLTTVFNNYAFAYISISAILALGLLAQTVMALVIENYGWFGLPQKKFKARRFIGISFVMAGIVCIMVL